jgi:hypothetical protein
MSVADQPPSGAAAPAPSVPEVTVTAERRNTIARQVEDIAQKDGKGQLARWSNPICTKTLGLQAAANDFIDTRIRTVANTVGAPSGISGCKPNVIILIAADADGLTKRIVKAQASALSTGRWGTDKAALFALQTAQTPVRWFYIADTEQNLNGAVNISPGVFAAAGIGSGLDVFDQGAGIGPKMWGNVLPSRLSSSGEESFSRTLILVNSHAIDDLQLGQVADYLAMVALSPVRMNASFSGINTVLGLFQAAVKPIGLTSWDRDYLSGLYKSASQTSVAGQVSHVVDWMEQHPSAASPMSVR